MRTELSAITAKFSGGLWQEALAALLLQSQLDQDLAGRRLHDEVGQNLSALGLQLSVLLLDFRERVPELSVRIPEIQALLEKAMVQVREIASELNPSIVDRAGLRYALENLLEQRRAGFPGELTLDFQPQLRVPRQAARALFRVAPACIDYAAANGSNNTRIKIIQQEFGWALEVLYNSLRSHNSEELGPGEKLILLSLHYQAMRVGVGVILDEPCAGTALIRAAYATEDRGN